jgi:hypothetical protein
VGRVAHGVPARVDRLRCLGNAVVPQVAEYVGRCILECLVPICRTYQECELCGGPVEPGEWRRCRRCRLDYGIAQHKPGERLYQT